MKLYKKQWRFAQMVQLLVGYARLEGYELTYGDAYRDDRCDYGHPDSLHRSRLAVDFNLFKNGELEQKNGPGHKKLHDFWDAIGGAKRIDNDLNHYSLKHNGMR